MLRLASRPRLSTLDKEYISVRRAKPLLETLLQIIIALGQLHGTDHACRIILPTSGVAWQGVHRRR